MVKSRIGELARAKGFEKAHHFAKASGLSDSRASALFNDQVTGMDFATMDKLSDFFDCPLADLFVKVITRGAKPAGMESASSGRSKRDGGRL